MGDMVNELFPVIHGMQWFPGTTQEMVDTFPKLLARQDDIYISTYPKAGKGKICMNMMLIKNAQIVFKTIIF